MSHNLYTECCNRPADCCCACFCPCIVFGDIFEIFDQKKKVTGFENCSLVSAKPRGCLLSVCPAITEAVLGGFSASSFGGVFYGLETFFHCYIRGQIRSEFKQTLVGCCPCCGNVCDDLCTAAFCYSCALVQEKATIQEQTTASERLFNVYFDNSMFDDTSP